jgi:hypothetical protein
MLNKDGLAKDISSVAVVVFHHVERPVELQQQSDDNNNNLNLSHLHLCKQNKCSSSTNTTLFLMSL